MKISKTSSTVAGLTRSERIRLHLLCPWRTFREARFHLAGIFREFKIELPV